MRLFVGCEVAGLGEALLAAGDGTLVGLFACVNSEMRPQVEVQGKGFATEFTSERLFPLPSLYSVHQHMSAQLRVVQKPLAAALDRAGVLSLSVSHGVLAQRACVREAFSTPSNVTSVGLFFCVFTGSGSPLSARHHLGRRPVLVCAVPLYHLIVNSVWVLQQRH